VSQATNTTFKVAAVQTSPRFLNLEGTIEKVCSLISEAASNGTSIVAFPEDCVARCSSGHVEIVGTGRSADTAENRLCQPWTERFEVVVTVPATPTGNGTCETT
jgi:predicted amidohydrolase